MKKTLAVLLLALASNYAIAAQALWTGRMELVQTVTYKYVNRCEYEYLGTKFWRLFPTTTFCPNTVDVE